VPLHKCGITHHSNKQTKQQQKQKKASYTTPESDVRENDLHMQMSFLNAALYGSIPRAAKKKYFFLFFFFFKLQNTF